jgi:hypothetical protein
MNNTVPAFHASRDEIGQRRRISTRTGRCRTGIHQPRLPYARMKVWFVTNLVTQSLARCVVQLLKSHEDLMSKSHIQRLARKQCFPGGMVACRSTFQVYIKDTRRLKWSYVLGFILRCHLQVFQRLQFEDYHTILEPQREENPRKAGDVKVNNGEHSTELHRHTNHQLCFACRTRRLPRQGETGNDQAACMSRQRSG